MTLTSIDIKDPVPVDSNFLVEKRYDNWLSRWFLLFVYKKENQTLSQPILYEEEYEYSLITRSKFPAEMVGLVEKIEELKKSIFQKVQILAKIASQYEDNEPAFLFDFKGNLKMFLPFELKKIHV
jgi:hypothetical protein